MHLWEQGDCRHSSISVSVRERERERGKERDIERKREIERGGERRKRDGNAITIEKGLKKERVRKRGEGGVECLNVTAYITDPEMEGGGVMY